MALDLVERLEQWKRRFDPSSAGQLERLLGRLKRARFSDAATLIRLHETLLFLRAYPLTEHVARVADEMLHNFAGRVAAVDDPDPFEEPEVSGIAGTSLTAVFSHEVSRRLATLHSRDVEIGWDRYDEQDRLGPAVGRALPMFKEDWPVEAHVPFERWIAAAHSRRQRDLQWLLANVGSPEQYDAMQVPVTWQMGSSRDSRSRMRLPVRRLFLHREPLLRRSDISLERELSGPPLPVKRLQRAEARRILDLILQTSAMRYRELYGFSHPDKAGVYHAAAGRGVDIYFFGVPPQWRLPLRAYHGAMFFKNGVPAGYVELLSFFERAEVGFNLYYTFREGESAWLYARLLRLFHQVLGVTCFSVDPYQIGHENAEAVESGAFWFYRKLGFRPTNSAVARLLPREEARLRTTPWYRSSKRTLEHLADGYLLYEMPGNESGDWDSFRIRTLAQRLQGEPRIAGEIARAKLHGSEARYLRWLQVREDLRRRCIRWGTE